jgi:glutamyl-tRNA synthetase
MVRTRIAPSPTGFPHVGTIFQALLDYVYAKQQQGQFIVRIEDTDRNRFVEGAEEAIYQSLEWAGIIPDESTKIGGSYGPYRQSERLHLYQEHAKKLVDQGHAYYCFCSPERLDSVRKEKQAAGLPPMYDRLCRNLDPAKAAAKAAAEPHVIRMKVPDNETIVVTDVIRGDISFNSSVVDDQVILKSDGFPTYHLAVVVDDHLMNITFMVRGEEWLSSSPKHILLYRYFGWEPPVMLHTPLLRNPDKSKLSKRHGHASVTWYQEQGYLPEAVVNFLASRIWNHPKGKEIFTIDELMELFKIEDIHIMSPIVDLKKLDWINGLWIRSLSDQELIKRLQNYIPQELSLSLLTQILPLVKERLVKLSDITGLTTFFYQDPQVDIKEVLKEAKTDEESLKNYIAATIKAIQEQEKWEVVEIETIMRRIQEEHHLKPRQAFMSLRLCLTGESATPPLFDVMQLLGKDVCVKRLESCLAKL